MNPDLIKVTEIFLVPNSFLVGALAAADTNLHRAGVSLLGLIISALWWICSHEALKELAEAAANANSHPRRTRILYALPLIFCLGWLVSAVGHTIAWNQPLPAAPAGL